MLRFAPGADPTKTGLTEIYNVPKPGFGIRGGDIDKDGVVRKVSARNLWIRILTARIETGEPYLVFSDHVNRAQPAHQ